ncbi:NFACT RNA binding domain-containing protein [Halarcobacter sp.]|uniref:NFACT RNA binding domain-containing protein n=1 Tax=Halarcobacter sp. TaxID=2321133 RepID=UPI0029F47BBF|nr:NFACT RNA binding domain-containing protein [Halarcobacter sp.]
MKYYLLKEVVTYLCQNTQKIKFVKRIDNNTIIIEFNNKNYLYFDMTKGKSLIYKRDELLKAKKDFNAPFDVILQKRFNNSIVEDIQLYNDDKVINIKVNSSSSYKRLTTVLQLEFTGKHTNIIILDENRIVLEALRHIDEFASSRVVKVGVKLDEIPKTNIVFKEEKVEDIEKTLYKIYEDLEKRDLENYRKQKISQVSKKLKKIEKLVSTLPLKENLEKESEQLYTNGNLILNNLYNIKPYQKSLVTYDFSGNEVEITLDTKIPASKYANELFKKAKRLKQKAINIKIEKGNLEEKISFLKRMILNLEKAVSIDEIEFLYPKKQKNQTKTKKSQNYESFFFEGYKIMLGTSERENIYLLQKAKASDFWFHLKDRPSSHLIVQNSKKTLPDSVIEKAAQICAQFSTDFAGTYEVDYTQRRNVKIQNGANVLYNPYTTIVVKV